jgi:hypothetical protein
MSLTADGKHITCDGEECREQTRVPVLLTASERTHPPVGDAAKQWLYVLRQGRSYHYCPRCARQQLAPIIDTDFG